MPELDYVFAALSDPTRRQMLAQLARGECSVTALSQPFPVSAPAISKHLRVLERAGLIARRKSGRVHFCRLLAEPLEEASGWIQQYRAFWEQQFDALAQYLEEEESECKVAPPSPPQSPSAPDASSRRAVRGSSKRGRSRKS